MIEERDETGILAELSFSDLLRIGDWEVKSTPSKGVWIQHVANKELSLFPVWPHRISDILSSFISRRERKTLISFAKAVVRHHAAMASVEAERLGVSGKNELERKLAECQLNLEKAKKTIAIIEGKLRNAELYTGHKF